MNDINKILDHRMIDDVYISEIKNYCESHRYYHNFDHILNMINFASNSGILTNKLLKAIIFHDIIYDPKANNNEERSANIALKYFNDKEIYNAILDTKTHTYTSSLGKVLCELDLLPLNGTLEDFIKFERKIFKEYQWVDYSIYKEKRIKVLNKLGAKEEYINYVRFYEPKIAVYPGSFNPFHKGHLNILQKAENIFDKVIIARGMNPEKRHEFRPLPEYLNYKQIEFYNGLLTDFIKSLKYDVTLIRGLRNSTDLQYELIQYRYLQDLYPEIKMVSIICDKEYEHISSSAIKQLEQYNMGNNYLV